jgi:hypothetical protein
MEVPVQLNIHILIPLMPGLDNFGMLYLILNTGNVTKFAFALLAVRDCLLTVGGTFGLPRVRSWYKP